MKISLGNAIYNHKPTDADMKWHSGFQNKNKQPIACPVREDTVENYAFAYDNGLCVKGNRRGEESDAFAAKLFDLSLSSTIVKAEPEGTKGKYGGVLRIQVEDCGGEPSNITADVIEKLLSMVDSTYARQDIVNANVELGGDIQI